MQIHYAFLDNVRVFCLSFNAKKKEKNQRNCRNKMKNIKYCTVGTVSKIIKSNRKGTETGKVDTPNTQLHERSLSWHGTGPSIKKVAGLN